MGNWKRPRGYGQGEAQPDEEKGTKERMAQSAWVKLTWVRCILHGWIVTSLVASPSSHVTSSCPIMTRNKHLHPNLVYLKLKHVWELWIQLSTVQLSTIYCLWSSVHDLLSTIWCPRFVCPWFNFDNGSLASLDELSVDLELTHLEMVLFSSSFQQRLHYKNDVRANMYIVTETRS